MIDSKSCDFVGAGGWAMNMSCREILAESHLGVVAIAAKVKQQVTCVPQAHLEAVARDW
jgi:hypothetical protein